MEASSGRRPTDLDQRQVSAAADVPQLAVIDPHRILSLGRVSPIDSEGSPAVAAAGAEEEEALPRDQAAALAPFVAVREDEEEGGGGLDLRLSLRGSDGRRVVMELDSAVLRESSAFFADMVPDASGGGGGGGKRVEVDGVDNLEAFKEAVELMFEPDAMRWLARAGVSRAIGVLEVRCIPFVSFSLSVPIVLFKFVM